MKYILLSCLIALTGLRAEGQPMVRGQVSEIGKIRVASYNLRMDTQRDGVNAWPFREQLVIDLIRFHEFDIVGTQEGFLHQLEALIRSGVFAYYGAGRDDGQQAGEHSAILYKKERYELLDSGDFWLSETPDRPSLGWDATCCHRITSWVKLRDRRNGSKFFVFNTHFDHQGQVAREQSAVLLLSKIREIAGDRPVICTGDFNSTPETGQMQAMAAGLSDAYEATAEPPYGPVGTFNGFDWQAKLEDRIDYVFVSPHFRVLRYATLTDAKDQRFPSDHLPVVTDLLLLPLISR